MGKLKQGVNDLYTWCVNNGEFGKQLIQEWMGLDENNQPISMDMITRASHIKVKWKCNQGHEWIADIHNRTFHRHKCKECTKVSHRNSLETWCLNNGEFGQQLLSEWVGVDENNQPILIGSIARASNKRVRWKCSKGHEWIADISHRTYCKSDCPFCYDEKRRELSIQNCLKTGNNDLYTWCLNNGEWGQQLMQEWVGLDENNQAICINNVARGSHIIVKWKCSNNHYWATSIVHRTKDKTSCPYCNSHGTSYPEQYLYYALKQLYPNTENRCKVLKSPENPRGIEFDIGIPEIPLCIEYSPTYWHEGKEEMDEYKKQICNQHKVRLIQIVEDSYNELDFKMENNYICFRMNQAKRTEIIQAILAHILKTINHSIDEINLEKVEQDTRKRLTAMYSVRLR